MSHCITSSTACMDSIFSLPRTYRNSGVRSLIELHKDSIFLIFPLQLVFQEFGSTALDFVEDDPLTLKEVHEHMIRSPPPISCWPHGKKKHATFKT